MNYFFDTSALVKIYHIEAGSDSVLDIYHSENSITISELGKVEFLSTVYNQKYREKEINEETIEAIINKFDEDLINKFKLFKFSSLVLDESWILIKKHAKDFSLRTLDCIQLAFFNAYREDEDVFVCADKRLVKVAELEGFTIMVPV
jgi:predicted nucleic acid-binding protein